jgi:hypothetical protein
MSKPILVSLSKEQLADLLSKSGGQPITADQIAQQIERGAPANPDGSIHLMNYLAWLVTQVTN